MQLLRQAACSLGGSKEEVTQREKNKAMSAPSSSRGSRPASLAGVPLLLFCSNAKRPYHQLSNFTAASVAVDGWTFPSVEHAYQSCKTDDRSRFAVGGDLAGEEAFSLLFPAATCEAKRRYWMAKGNLGVLAKMATKDGAMRRLGLRRNRDFVESEELWMRLLEAKYAQEPFKSLLLGTGNAYLLEFQRGARREEEASGAASYWGGLVDDQGRLWGRNVMGVYHMEVRDRLRRGAIASTRASRERSRSAERARGALRTSSSSRVRGRPVLLRGEAAEAAETAAAAATVVRRPRAGGRGASSPLL